MKPLIFLLSFLIGCSLFAKDIPSEMNGFKLGSPQIQIISHAKEIGLKESFPANDNSDILMFKYGIFGTFSPESWTFLFFHNKCYCIACTLESLSNDLEDMKNLLIEKYGEPSSFKSESDLPGYKWTIKDDNTYSIELVNNAKRNLFFLTYTNVTLENESEAEDKETNKSKL